MIKNLRQYRATPPSFDEIMGNDNPIPSFNDIMGEEVKKKERLPIGEMFGKVAQSGGKGLGNVSLSSLQSQSTSTENPNLNKPLFEEPKEDDPDPIGTLSTNVNNAFGDVHNKLFELNNQFQRKDATATGINYPEVKNDYGFLQGQKKRLVETAQQIENTINYGADITTNDAKERLSKIAKTPLPNQRLEDLTDEELRASIPQTKTNQSIVNRYINNRNIYKAIQSAPTMEQSALEWAKYNPDMFPSGIKEHLVEQLNKTAPDGKPQSVDNAQMGYILSTFLNQPATKEIAGLNPKNKAIYEATKKKLFTQYPDYGIQVIANELSQQREDAGMNNGILNVTLPSSWDKLAEQNLKEGKWSKEQYDLYNSRKNDVMGKLRTSGLIENAGRSFGDMVFKEVPGAIKDIVTLKPLRDNSVEDVKKAINKQYTETHLETKGVHSLTQLVGEFGGQMLGIGGVAKVLKGFGMATKGANATSFMLTMEHPIREEALRYFPNDPLKREAYVQLNNVVNGVFGALISREKPIEGLDKILSKGAKKEFTDEVISTINKFTKKEITTDAAKQAVENSFTNLITKYATKTLEHNTIQALQMGGLQAVKDVTDKVFGAREITMEDFANDVYEATKTAFIGNLPLATLGAHADITGESKIAASAVYEMAADPIRYRALIQNLALSDPKYKGRLSEALNNLDIAANLKTEMDANPMVQGLKPIEKQKYLFQSLSQKILEQQLQNTTDNVLKSKIKEQIKQSENFNKRLIDKTPLEVKEPTPKEKEEGVKAYYEDEKNVKGLAEKISKGLPLSDEDLQLHKNFPEAVETELQKIHSKDLKEKNDSNRTEKESEILQPTTVAENSRGLESNEPIAERGIGEAQGIPEATEKPIVREQSYQTKSGKYSVEYDNGNRVIKDKDGNIIPEFNEDGSRNRKAKDILREHDKQYNYNFGERADETKAPQFSTPEEADKWTIENSSSPSEVAEIYHRTEKETVPLSEKELAIAEHGIGKVTEESYKRHGDKNNVTNAKAKTYFGSKKDTVRTRPIDVIAKSISDATGLDITPQDIVDFIDRFPNGDALTKRDGEVRQQAAAKFKELTGIDITERIAKNAAEQGLKQEQIDGAENEFNRQQHSEEMPEEEVRKWLEEESLKVYENDNTENNNLEDYDRPQQPFNEGELADVTEPNRANPISSQDMGENTGKPKTGTSETGVSEGNPTNSKTTEGSEQDRSNLAKVERTEPKGDSEEVKKTIATIRSYEGEFREGVKREIEKLGLTRDVENQQEAKQKAKDFIDTVGEDAALEAVRNNDVSDGVGAYVWNELVEANDRKLATETNPEKIRQLEEQQAQLIQEWSRKALSAGRFNAALNDIYQNSDLGYNVEKKIQDYKDQNGGIIPEEVEKKFREIDAELKSVRKQLAEAEQKLKEEQSKETVLTIQEDIKKKGEQKKKEYQSKALDAIAKVRQKIKANAYSDAVGMVAIVDAGLVTIEKAIKAGIDISRAIEKGITHIKKQLKEKGVDVWEKEENFRNDVTAAFKEGGVEVKKPEIRNGKLSVPKDLIRSLVEEGIDNIEDLTKAVHEIVKEDLPDVTERQVRDAITDYGKTVSLNKEEIATQIRKMKRIGRILSGLEDIAEQKRPLKSGLQRDKLDAKERALQKELREAMKELPADQQVLEEQQRTATDAAKQRLRNQIEDLQREIDRKELVPRSHRSVQEDAELKTLREQRDQLKSEHDKIFKDEEFQNKKRVEQAKVRTKKSIEDLQRRIKVGDFSKKEKPKPISDSELTKLKAEKLRLQDEYDKEFYKNKLKNRTRAEKIKDTLWDAWGLTRLLRATGEMSFVGVQGLIQTIAHPIYATKALKNAFKFFASEKKTQDFLRNIKAQEWYPELKQSKLGLTETHAELTAREELFYSDWANMIWNFLGSPLKLKSESIYNKWKDLSPFKAFERMAVGYLDTIRVLRFLDGREMLREKGLTIEKDPQAYKEMADVINTFTGRASLGKAELIAPQLTKIFFSPRNWASAIKTATPYAFIHFGKMRAGAEAWKPSVAQKMAIADFSKFVGFTTGMMMLAAAKLNNDDDENTGVEFDPTSSDFMKIKLGGIRVDPWGGRIQQVILTSRLIAGSIKNNKGEHITLGTPFKAPTRTDLLVQMATNKLAPSAAIINRYFSSRVKKDGTRVDQYGNEFDLSDEFKNNLYPIYWDTVNDLMKDDPNAIDGLLLLYAFIGGGVNKYENKKDKK